MARRPLLISASRPLAFFSGEAWLGLGLGLALGVGVGVGVGAGFVFSGEAFLERPKGSKRLKGTWLGRG